MKGKITNLPIYGIGEVIDISYKHGGLPNRILIMSVGTRECDIGWQYRVTLENTGEQTNMAEQFIAERESNKTAKTKKNPEIIRRYRDGYRWCGNSVKAEAIGRGNLIAMSENVHDVKLYPAIGAYNQMVKGQYGLWIRYNHPIMDDGVQLLLECDDCITIK